MSDQRDEVDQNFHSKESPMYSAVLLRTDMKEEICIARNSCFSYMGGID